MSLSDCPKCWDTPCTCGHMGYTIIYHKNGASINKRMDRLEAENAALKAEVEKLAEQNTDNPKLPLCNECPCLRDPCTVDRESPICIDRVKNIKTKII